MSLFQRLSWIATGWLRCTPIPVPQITCTTPWVWTKLLPSARLSPPGGTTQWSSYTIFQDTITITAQPARQRWLFDQTLCTVDNPCGLGWPQCPTLQWPYGQDNLYFHVWKDRLFRQSCLFCFETHLHVIDVRRKNKTWTGRNTGKVSWHAQFLSKKAIPEDGSFQGLVCSPALSSLPY